MPNSMTVPAAVAVTQLLDVSSPAFMLGEGPKSTAPPLR